MISILKLQIISLFIVTSYSCDNKNSGNNNLQEKMEKEYQKKTEVRFANVDTKPALNSRIGAFDALIRFSEIQQASSAGLNFEFEIHYKGDVSCSISNPIYYLLYLIKCNGKYLSTISKAPIPLVNRRGSIDFNEDFNFDFVKVSRNDIAVDIKEEVNSPIIHFKKNEYINYSLQIPKVINPITKELMAMQPDLYELEFTFSLIDTTNSIDDRQFRTLKANNIAIKLE